MVASIVTVIAQSDYNIILGRPTNSSITVSVLFESAALFQINYGPNSGSSSVSTAEFAAAGETQEIDLTNLTTSTRYYYTLRYSLDGGVNYQVSPEYDFITQRQPGESYTFTIESDEHLYDHKGVENLYKVTVANQKADNPDFMLSLGDTFGDDHEPFTITSNDLDVLHKNYRPLLGEMCHSVPFYFCLGNHEGESDYYYNITPPENLCIWATEWRKYYFPNPYPNNFYSGNEELEPYNIGYPENYYAWTWGDALFVVLDVYRYAGDTTAMPHGWTWSLGETQYNWLKTTLEQSTATHKLVFGHHVRGYGRGGILEAQLYEWGGYQQIGGNYTFDNRRPGWAAPIHQLFVDNGVDIFFQGHDHVFAHEVLDNVVYQSMPMAADSTYEIGMLANADAYTADTLDGSGHLRVFVSPECVQVDFVRAYLPADTVTGEHQNREVAFSYTLGECATSNVPQAEAGNQLVVYPNPANNYITWKGSSNSRFEILDLQGRRLKSGIGLQSETSDLSNGTYLLRVHSNQEVYTSKIKIQH
jgi:hypothetical protein